MAASAQELVQLYANRKAFCERLEQTHVPDSLKQANDENWKLRVDELELATIEHYTEEQRKLDSQRIIPLSVALSVIREVEEDMVSKLVLDPLDIYFTEIAGKYKYAKYLIGGLSDWREIWADIQTVAGVLWEILSRLNIDVDLTSISGALKTAVSLVKAGLEVVFGLGLKVFEVTLSFAAVAVIAPEVTRVMKRRDSFVLRMRKKALPQKKTVKRWPRRKVSRK